MKKIQREKAIENAVENLNQVEPMSLGERVAWAVGILIVDLVMFFAPLTALCVFAIILIRPEFFKRLVDRLYADIKE